MLQFLHALNLINVKYDACHDMRTRRAECAGTCDDFEKKMREDALWKITRFPWREYRVAAALGPNR